MKPYYLDVRGWGMDQAFMFIERPPNREPPTDADLAEMKVTWAELGIESTKPKVRDLWEHKDLDPAPHFSTEVPSHGVILLKVTQ